MPENQLKPLFESYTGQSLSQLVELPSSGSNRRYFRLKGGNLSLIGVLGNNLEENRAFIYLSRHFREKGLRVPAVLAVSEDGFSYLQEELGEKGLFNLVSEGRESGIYSPRPPVPGHRTTAQTAIPGRQGPGLEPMHV